MEPMAGKLRCDNSTTNWAIWVTNESWDSAGRSSKIVSKRTPETYMDSKWYGQSDKLKAEKLARSCLLKEHMCSQRMGVIEFIT